ncbi:hypothetical protein CMQ_7863 [Grosmannia clavigera kw1407]|uniref:Uncharacterized protein n=1 Tax=Grosmannia clavigera (strain kw1407 / UAMH 11150) TaxID=655863 RepID=F0XS28_GROCL|nr:uncharacterized protein CMQ_7863 [Grosmannia clavigera kw1407]EFW99495.1 hypothetical protein CMQ_7863 [Grosmannia clavigera kw1407]
MHGVLSDGYRKLLSNDKLPHIDRMLEAAKLRRAVLLARDQRDEQPQYHIFTQTSRYAARPMKSRQSAWNGATQQRVSMTSTAIGAMKSIKMLGIQTAVEIVIIQLREAELS